MGPPPKTPEPRRSILVAGEDPALCELVRSILGREGYHIETAADGQEALDKLEQGCDLVVAGVALPKIDGIELTRRIRGNSATEEIPVIVATAVDAGDARLKAVEAGANDFITTPVTVLELQVRVKAQLRLAAALTAVKQHQDALGKAVEAHTSALLKSFRELKERETELRDAHLETVHRLAVAAEFKDQDIEGHLERVEKICGSLAGWIGLPEEECDVVLHASTMHDIGKIGVPEAILFKPGKITDEERAVMQRHPQIGARILAGSKSKYIAAGEIVSLTHHEKWDGTGYPQGLKGEQIPLYGRICAIADVYDALISKRPHKAAFSISNSLEIMREYRGNFFDPRLVEAFLDNHAKL